MKKLFAIVALSLFAFTSSVFASSVTVEANHTQSKDNSLAIVPSIDLLGLTFDARLKASRTLAGQNAESAEIRVAKSINVAQDVDFYVRGGLGKNYVSAASSNTFYSVEPGVKFTVNPSLSFKVSDRYTNAFGSAAKNTYGNEFGAEVDLALNKEDSVGLKLYKLRGDLNAKGVQASYTRTF